MIKDLSNLGLSAIRRITDLWAGAKSDSLIDYTQNARVEPIVLIDNSVLFSDSLPHVQQSMLSIFAGYYLQAVAISTNVGKVEVMRTLDKLNPSRNLGNSAAHSAEWLLAQESYRHRLPCPNDPRREIETQLALEDLDERKFAYQKDKDAELYDYQQDRDATKDAQWEHQQAAQDARDQYQRDHDAYRDEHQFGIDAQKLDNDKQKLQQGKDSHELNREKLVLDKARRQDELDRSEFAIGRDTMNSLKELSNLSVGKLLSVEISDGLHKVALPIAIRLIASALPTENLVHILSIGNQNNSVKERYHAWRSGRLEFIKDLVMCQDLIDAHRKNLMHDKDGIYTNLLQRNRANQLSAIVTANPSVATASNLVIMSQATAEQLELKVHGKLKDFKTREKVFKNTYMMIMAVIDDQWGRVTFYHRGIPTATQVGVNDLKASNKNSGPDVSDILKAYQLGNAPSL